MSFVYSKDTYEYLYSQNTFTYEYLPNTQSGLRIYGGFGSVLGKRASYPVGVFGIPMQKVGSTIVRNMTTGGSVLAEL